jgi:hypothetical protein|tara:strand:- start:9327 stop:9665 length:339 start_codon:yes stop_codon:yes gene_type:complete
MDRRDIQLLIAVVAQRTERAAAIGKGAAPDLELDPPFGALQMIGQCAHRRGSLGGRSVGGAAVCYLGFAFELIEGELVTEGIDQRIARRRSGFEFGYPGVLVDRAESKAAPR